MESLMTFLECIFDCIPHREAIHGNPWQSMAIRGNPWQSVAIHGNLWQSGAIRGHQRPSATLTSSARLMIGAISDECTFASIASPNMIAL